MIIQEPVQAAIWHCLNQYDYSDAIFLSERLYAEVKTDENLYLLSTAYYRNGEKDHAYHILKKHSNISSQCRFLFGICAYDLEKYAEAEAAFFEHDGGKINSLDEISTQYGDQASFVLHLLGKIASKTERKTTAIKAWKKSLEINPFLWSSFECLCNIGEKPNPDSIFQLNGLENLSMCHGNNLTNNIESIVTNINQSASHESTPKDMISCMITTPQQILSNCNPNTNSTNVCTPEESPLANPLSLSGFAPIPTSKYKSFKYRLGTSPSFGRLFDASPDITESSPIMPQLTLTESNNYNHLLSKRLKPQVTDNFINRKETVLQNSKPIFNQCITVNKTPTLQPNQNVRRSLRLFSNSYSVKENNKSPTRTKFVTPKSPTKKTKQRVAKCNLNKNNTYSEINTRNKMEKEKSETITSTEVKSDRSAITNNLDNYLQKAIHIQKQSAEGLMLLLRTLGRSYLELSGFNCTSAIDILQTLPSNQFDTAWVQRLLGLAHFEMAEYDSCIKYFNEIHIKEPYKLTNMDVYSTALWHLQKEVALSVLASELVDTNTYSAVTWCVSGNCFSLHKEHETAIKFFQRAVQVDPNFPYAYTLLGHEYITAEELDKAMNCFRNAIRLDPRHYNAWFGIGTIYSKQERYRLAEMNYKRALSINPQSSVILCHIGVVQHALKQTEKALNTFNLAIASNPKSPLCKFHRGSVYFALGRHAEALKELEELKQIVPKESLVYYLIGKVHKKLGNTDLALMHFSWATDLDPKGVSSQIKEGFDPSVRRSGSEENESPSSPTGDEYNIDNNFRQQLRRNSFAGLPEDSEDSF